MAVAIGLGLGFGLYQLQVQGFDGDAYWNAALRLRDGSPLYFDGAPNDPLVYRYPAWFAWAWMPLTYLSHDVVMGIWRVTLVAAALSIVPPLIGSYWGRVGLVAFVPMLMTAGWGGNVQPLLVALAVYARPWSIGLAGGIKALPVLLGGVYAWRRQWLELAVAVGITAALWSTTLIANWWDYPTARGIWPTDLAIVLALVPLLDGGRTMTGDEAAWHLAPLCYGLPAGRRLLHHDYRLRRLTLRGRASLFARAMAVTGARDVAAAMRFSRCTDRPRFGRRLNAGNARPGQHPHGIQSWSLTEAERRPTPTAVPPPSVGEVRLAQSSASGSR